MKLSKVVAIVSGGSSGLGAAATKKIVLQGGHVVVADLPETKARFDELALQVERDCTKKALSSPTIRLVFAETDVTPPDQISNSLDLAETHFEEPVNAAVSCAGIAPVKTTLTVKNDEIRVHPADLFSRALDVNVAGSFHLARLSAERMMSRSLDENKLRGCIVNTASISPCASHLVLASTQL